LVGRDAKLPDILILVSTLGGLGLFGAAGLIIGPVVAGLFIAIWETMRDVMAGHGFSEPEVETAPSEGQSPASQSE
ncbi:MAG: AI-2E family transporter, partial [Rhodobacteraceae bacterium]|nr:AI-2E family transporter [Paracoccaceae bacterium]